MVPRASQEAMREQSSGAPIPPVKHHSSSSILSLLQAHTAPGRHYLQSGGVSGSGSPPPAPTRDASSLKAVRYGPGHEKFPSWPAPVPTRSAATAGGSSRSKSWTEQTHYPKEEPPVISRPYNKRINPAFSQQLRTVMERCEKIGPESYLPRLDCDGTKEYNVPSPPERDVGLTQADLEEYARSYGDPSFTQLEAQLTQAELEQYSRVYDEASLRTVHQTQASYAQSEGYHSYVSSTDSTTTTPFLDRLRRESEAARSQEDMRGHESSASSGSSSETLKWHGSMSDVSSTGTPSTTCPPLIAHSAKVQTPQRHHSESVLYLSQLVRNNQINNQRKLFPVSTYTVQPSEQTSPRSPPAMTVAERISELERQQAAPQQPRVPYPITYEAPQHRHVHPSHENSRVTDHASLKAIQKKALLSFYERHHSAWKSEPQLSPPQPPPRPKPPPTTSVASRRSSSASDYAGCARREQKMSKDTPSHTENESLPVRHQHSSSCGSLTAAVSGPFIMGPAISIDDWVPARPPKKPHLRAAYPVPRMSSPDLPPPSPPPVVEDEVFVSDEPLPPPPTEDQLPDLKSSISSFPRSLESKPPFMTKSSVESSNTGSAVGLDSTNRPYLLGNSKSYVSERSKPEPQYENQPELRRCSKVRESCRGSFVTSRDKDRDLERFNERRVCDESQILNLNKNRAIYQRQKSLESYFKNSSLKEDCIISDDQIPVGPRINLDLKSIETLFPAKSEVSLRNYEEVQPTSLESNISYIENHSQGFNKPGPQTPVDKKHSSSQLKAFGGGIQTTNPLRALDGNSNFRHIQNQFIRSASVRRDLHSSQSSEVKAVSKSPFQLSSERKSLRYSTTQKLLVNVRSNNSLSAQNGRVSPPSKIQHHVATKLLVTSSTKLLPSRYSADHSSNSSTTSEPPSHIIKQLPQSLPAQCPPTSLQLSQSKASYLASYRREPRERERGLPNFEGSYKRTMSPSGGHIIHSSEPIKEKSASQDSGLDDKQSYSEGSKSPSQENLASSTVSSCDNIETSKTLPRNYSLSLLSPTKRPMRTPRTQSDPIKSTPREVIEEVTKVCEPKSDIELSACERLENVSVNVSTSTEESVGGNESNAVHNATTGTVGETERTLEEPLRLLQRTEVTLRVNAPTTDTACQTDVVSTPLPTPTTCPSPPVTRHQLDEEIECDQLSRDLASQLSPSHRLQGILAPGPEVKRSTDYVSGLFRLDMTPRMRTSVASTTQTTVTLPPTPPSNSKEEEKAKESDRLPSDSAYFTTSECKARLLLYSQNQEPPLPGNTNLHQKKEELMSRLSRKLSVLRAEAVAVEEECQVNEALGHGVSERVSTLARPQESSKYRLHVKEVGHITSLLLGLSGRLARAENALLGLSEDHIDRKTLEGKRDKLQTQLEEAKELKRNIDRRSDSVSAMLYKYLTAEEYADYDHFIHMKAKLLVDSREIADKIQLGEEQLAALREMLNEPR